MSTHEITYHSRFTGKQETHHYTGSDMGAKAWAEGLASDNDCKASAFRVEDSGERTHLVSHGHDKS